jgi:hypothetical protein
MRRRQWCSSVRGGAVAVALVAIFGLATGFHEPPTAPPPVDPIDRGLYNKGSSCYRSVMAQYSALNQASQSGSLAQYDQAATRLRNKAAACVTKIENANPSGERGMCAQPIIVKAFKQFRDAGKFFQQAADASAAGNAGTASAKTASGVKKVNAANASLGKADGILRGTRACP